MDSYDPGHHLFRVNNVGAGAGRAISCPPKPKPNITLLFVLSFNSAILYAIWLVFWHAYAARNDRFLCEDNRTGYRIRLYSGGAAPTFISSFLCLWLCLYFFIQRLYDAGFIYLAIGLIFVAFVLSGVYTYFSEKCKQMGVVVNTHYGTMDVPGSEISTEGVIYLYNIDAVLIRRYPTGDNYERESYMLQLRVATLDRRDNTRTLGTHSDKAQVQKAADWLAAKLGVPVEKHRNMD